ncbi:MAG TPA: hypothetical protein VM802_18175 [Chitinophaga sp.]|uniref:hypothetical protein n=1 Tax=Chitinophaga sp. TaxID=1869181 RepID=UPI002BE1FFB7|nr:hypothetical protein [Chitinophaga sp.]HVI46812.1 hypothetical protein [Chitinophaga sp.]
MDISDNRSFTGTVIAIKSSALESGIEITDRHVAASLGISDQRLQQYLVSDDAPEKVVEGLYTVYKEYLKNRIIARISVVTDVIPPDPPIS